mgnify:CR=1 FL=1
MREIRRVHAAGQLSPAGSLYFSPTKPVEELYDEDEQSLVIGSAMHEGELQAVLKSLRGAGINIVAIHNHMMQDEPRFVFLHYWGKGPAASLAKGLKSALDTQSR